MADDLELAASLVRDAGRLAADMLREGLSTKRKTSVSDVVSAADHAAEELIVSRLREARPDDGIVGEEGTNQPAGSGGRTWFVDPVDGTYNFLSGLPVWCAAVGLADADGPVLGAVYQPVTDELWLGGRDHPTSYNGLPVAPLADQPLADVSLASYVHPTTLPDDTARVPLLRVMQEAATVRMLGSGSVELASVASGRLGAWAQIDSLDWDWVPGAALVAAAGGATAVFIAGGHRWHVAGSSQVVDEVTSLVRGAAGTGAHLEALATAAVAPVGATANVTVSGALDDLPPAVIEIVEAVAREAVANVVRHAYAGTVWLDVRVTGGELSVIVRDDGVGPTDEPIEEQPEGHGLRRMLGWATTLGGTCTIEPNEPLGTRLTWTVPTA